ncbi:hypothetical protein OIO90_002596 [Microbotryomycetes sp. JL221]|nr:hypothetical protein OIO90_002596 [Microbotryomycetes sp. JL221]
MVTRRLSMLSNKHDPSEQTDVRDTPLRRVTRSFHRLKTLLKTRSTANLRSVVQDEATTTRRNKRESNATIGPATWKNDMTRFIAGSKRTRDASKLSTMTLVTGSSTAPTMATTTKFIGSPRRKKSEATLVSYPTLQSSSLLMLDDQLSSSPAKADDLRIDDKDVRPCTPLVSPRNVSKTVSTDSSPASNTNDNVSMSMVPTPGLGLQWYAGTDSSDSLIDPQGSSRWWTSTLNSASPSIHSTDGSIQYDSDVVAPWTREQQSQTPTCLESKFSSMSNSIVELNSMWSQDDIIANESKQGFVTPRSMPDEDIFSSPSVTSMSFSPTMTTTSCLSPISTQTTYMTTPSSSKSKLNLNSPPTTPTPWSSPPVGLAQLRGISKGLTTRSTPSNVIPRPTYSFARTPPLTIDMSSLPPTPQLSRPVTPLPPLALSKPRLTKQDDCVKVAVDLRTPTIEQTMNKASVDQTDSCNQLEDTSFTLKSETQFSNTFATTSQHYMLLSDSDQDSTVVVQIDVDKIKTEPQPTNASDESTVVSNENEEVQPWSIRALQRRLSQIVWLDDAELTDDEQDQQHHEKVMNEEDEGTNSVISFNTISSQSDSSDVDLDFDHEAKFTGDEFWAYEPNTLFNQKYSGQECQNSLNERKRLRSKSLGCTSLKDDDLFGYDSNNCRSRRSSSSSDLDRNSTHQQLCGSSLKQIQPVMLEGSHSVPKSEASSFWACRGMSRVDDCH